MMNCRPDRFHFGISLLGIALVFLSCSRSHQVKTNEPSVSSLLAVTKGEDAPSCLSPCTNSEEQKITMYTHDLLQQGKTKEAIDFLRQCNINCPKVTCTLQKSYANKPELVPPKEYSKNMIAISELCLSSSPVGFSTKDFLSVQNDLDTAKKIEAELRRINPAGKKAGYALIGIGTAMLISFVILEAFTVGDGQYIHRPFSPDNCSSQGIFGDPCYNNILPASIPLATVGAASLAIGIGLAVHFKW